MKIMQAAPLLQILLVSQAVIAVTNMNAAELEMQPLPDQAAAAIFTDKGMVQPFCLPLKSPKIACQ